MKRAAPLLERFTHSFVKWTGTTWGFIFAFGFVFTWLLTADWLKSTSLQNLLGIFVNIVTFLMLFLMQRSQNKEFQSMQVKLNELIVVQEKASNDLINIEKSTEQHIDSVQQGHDKHKS